jgi:hypothetical protein
MCTFEVIRVIFFSNFLIDGAIYIEVILEIGNSSKRKLLMAIRVVFVCAEPAKG